MGTRLLDFIYALPLNYKTICRLILSIEKSLIKIVMGLSLLCQAFGEWFCMLTAVLLDALSQRENREAIVILKECILISHSVPPNGDQPYRNKA